MNHANTDAADAADAVGVGDAADTAAPGRKPALMRIELAWSPAPRTVELLSLHLPAGSTVRDALQASGLAARVPESPAGAVPVRHPGTQADSAGLDPTMRSKTDKHGNAALAISSSDTSAPRPSNGTSAQALGAKPGAKAHAAEERHWRGLSLAVFGRKLTLDSELFDGDRLDCCRPLRVDPKLARRERFNQQGSRRSGLFAKRREGSVAGY